LCVIGATQVFKKSNIPILFVFIYIDRGRRYKISCSICGGGAALLYEKAIKFDDRWAIKSAHAALVIKGVLGEELSQRLCQLKQVFGSGTFEKKTGFLSILLSKHHMANQISHYQKHKQKKNSCENINNKMTTLFIIFLSTPITFHNIHLINLKLFTTHLV
jgi:hypothetical protein